MYENQKVMNVNELVKGGWKWCYGYEDLYVMNSKGIVCKVLKRKDGYILKEKVQTKNNSGYYIISLSKEGKVTSMTVHRLLMMTFKPTNGMDKLEVNHIDENKENNVIDNLEWCTRQYNVTYSYGKRVRNVTLGIDYDSLSEAGLSVDRHPASISSAIKRNTKCCNYYWEFI